MSTAEAGTHADVTGLNLEVGYARSSRIRDTLMTFDQFVPGQGQRRALTVEAAHTSFPEAGLEHLPPPAHTETRRG